MMRIDSSASGAVESMQAPKKWERTIKLNLEMVLGMQENRHDSSSLHHVCIYIIIYIYTQIYILYVIYIYIICIYIYLIQ